MAKEEKKSSGVKTEKKAPQYLKKGGPKGGVKSATREKKYM